MVGRKKSEIALCEGITEYYYLNSIRELLTTRPTPKIVKPYNMDELKRAIESYAVLGATRIHCLIDMDTKVSSPVTMTKYLQLKQKYHKKVVRKTDCEVFFYESLPSIERFFSYYFEYSTAEKGNEELKSWLKDKCKYGTHEHCLMKPSLHSRFVSYGGCLSNAIQNAKKSTAARTAGNYNCSYTEIGELIERLGIKL